MPTLLITASESMHHKAIFNQSTVMYTSFQNTMTCNWDIILIAHFLWNGRYLVAMYEGR